MQLEIVNPASDPRVFRRWQRELQMSCYILCANLERLKHILSQKYEDEIDQMSSTTGRTVWSDDETCAGSHNMPKNHACARWNMFVAIEASLLYSLCGDDDPVDFKYRNEVVEVTQAVERIVYESATSKSSYMNTKWTMAAINCTARSLASDVIENYQSSFRNRVMHRTDGEILEMSQSVAEAA